MNRFTLADGVESVAQALATIRAHPRRSALAGLAMAAAVATTAVVQTGLTGLARSAREASARAFGSDSFVITGSPPAPPAGACWRRRTIVIPTSRDRTFAS